MLTIKEEDTDSVHILNGRYLIFDKAHTKEERTKVFEHLLYGKPLPRYIYKNLVSKG